MEEDSPRAHHKDSSRQAIQLSTRKGAEQSRRDMVKDRRPGLSKRQRDLKKSATGIGPGHAARRSGQAPAAPTGAPRCPHCWSPRPPPRVTVNIAAMPRSPSSPESARVAPHRGLPLVRWLRFATVPHSLGRAFCSSRPLLFPKLLS